MTARTLIVGGGHAGRLLAGRLAETETSVDYVDDDENAVRNAQEGGVDARAATLTNPRALQSAVPDSADRAIAATSEDSVNLLVAQILRTQLDAGEIIVLVNDPRNHVAFEELDIETVCASTVVSTALAGTPSRNDDRDDVDTGRRINEEDPPTDYSSPDESPENRRSSTFDVFFERLPNLNVN